MSWLGEKTSLLPCHFETKLHFPNPKSALLTKKTAFSAGLTVAPSGRIVGLEEAWSCPSSSRGPWSDHREACLQKSQFKVLIGSRCSVCARIIDRLRSFSSVPLIYSVRIIESLPNILSFHSTHTGWPWWFETRFCRIQFGSYTKLPICCAISAQVESGRQRNNQIKVNET